MSFFFNDTATTEIYTLSLHDALPIYPRGGLVDQVDRLVGKVAILDVAVGEHGGGAKRLVRDRAAVVRLVAVAQAAQDLDGRSEEHTSELQSRQYLVCRLLLEKKQ